MNPWHLGASLYVPATRCDLVQIASGEKYPFLRSVIFCTEDSVREDELPLALSNLSDLFSSLGPSPVFCFVRVRNFSMLERVLAMPRVERLDGLVLPKFGLEQASYYFDQLRDTSFWLMPILETKEVFDSQSLVRLRNYLMDSPMRPQILSLRVGSQDLLSLLRLRRKSGHTIYETPVGWVIDHIVGTFKPYGFEVSASVFDGLYDYLTLGKEVVMDLEKGLVGKSAIHPFQVSLIESAYQVDSTDLNLAQAILHSNVSAVFQSKGLMHEPAVHSNWAQEIITRARIYGCKKES